MHISTHQDGLARLLARKSGRLSSIGGALAARQPLDTFTADNDQATALAFPRVGARMVRLDPARGIADDVWWQSTPTADVAALAVAQGDALGQTSGETFEAWPDSKACQMQLAEPRVELPGPGLQTLESELTAPLRDLVSVPSTEVDEEPDIVLLPLPAVVPTPDAAGGRSRRWLSPARMLRRLHLFPVRSRTANAITSLLFRRKTPATPASEPLEPDQALNKDALPAEIQVVVRADLREDRSVEPPRSAEASLNEAVAVADSLKEPDAAAASETLSVAEVARQVSAKAKEGLGLSQGAPVFLFAGEMSYAAGVDILTDALITVCQGHQEAQFVFVGDGPLKNDAEAQVAIAGFAHRCRFTGDLPPATFERFLAACDVVVIPAREGQESGLSEQALSLGKPVLTTHQAQVRGIAHGQNGLVAYDCANSMVWGLRELIAKPLHPHPQQDSVERRVA